MATKRALARTSAVASYKSLEDSDAARQRFPAGRAIAPCYENHNLSGRIHANLMRVDSQVERRRLFDLGADSPVLGKPVHGYAARIVVSDQHMRPRDVDRDVNRP